MDCGGNNYFMCNYENKNDDRRVLTQRNAARYGKEETVKIPAYYQMIGVNAFQSNIKMKNLLLPNGLQEISTNAFRCSKALREVALHTVSTGWGTAVLPSALPFVSRICRKVWKKFQRICSGKTGGCKRFFLPETVK